LHTLRISAAFAAGLLVCALSASSAPFGLASAQAQKLTEVRKKPDRKGPTSKASQKAPTSKDGQKDQQERASFTVEEEDAAVIPGIPDARVWGDSATGFMRLLSAANGPWLAISGGGSDGAYGAGVLTGWTESGTRPEFSVVTGVSIGALIAPFAFLGPRYDEEVHKNFTTIGAADIFEDRTTRDSLFDFWPLKRLVEDRITAKLLSEIAAEHARGRRLFVVTTNLDSGRRVVWNMGAIASRGDEAALKLFREVLLASSSIPGFFSPVLIEVEANGKKFHEMHSDGTLTAPFFVMPESMLSASGGAGKPFSQLYVIVNSKLGPEFSMPDRNIPGVLGRSIAVALTAALRAELMLISVGAQRHDFTLRIAHVDPAFNHPSRGPFDGKYMQALYEFGVVAGKAGTAFGNALPDLSMRGSSKQ
jgi:hypothetical protein